MIPTAIMLGLFGGLIPRYRWWSIPLIGLTWSVILATEGDPTMSWAQIWFAGFVFGALNGAIGVLATWSVIHLARELTGSIQRRWARR
jgi:hypothetical protein